MQMLQFPCRGVVDLKIWNAFFVRQPTANQANAMQETRTSVSTTRAVLQMGLVVLLGMPVVAYLWETLNQLLSLHVNPMRLLISLPLLAVFIVWLRWLARQAQRWMEAGP
ncbi:hypothetical protein SAMN04488087_0354 [Rhodothermus profundi]|uniref:Uncharacterized protein n=2 Tax=Rhodothermus profundi TaxID=633813 RepID=A0A1M6PW14_9BACT|nr:hypothetical protein SAMN04488087_0354 [Rhodothermus profundi]